jgi:hypothetical protein
MHVPYEPAPLRWPGRHDASGVLSAVNISRDVVSQRRMAASTRFLSWTVMGRVAPAPTGRVRIPLRRHGQGIRRIDRRRPPNSHPTRRRASAVPGPNRARCLTPASANNTSGVAPQRQPVRWTAPVGVGYSPGSRDRRPAARPARGSRDAAIHRARFMDLGRRDLVPSIAESGRGRVDPRRTATSGRHGGHRLGRTRRRSPNTTTRRRGLHKAGQVRRIGWPTSSLVCRR